MAVKRINSGKFEGLYKAIIDFPNSYAKIGTYEYFELKDDAEYWLKRIKLAYGDKR